MKEETGWMSGMYVCMDGMGEHGWGRDGRDECKG